MKNSRTKGSRLRAFVRPASSESVEQPKPAARMLTRVQVARALGCSVSYVRKLEANGRLPVYEVDGVHVYVTRDVELLRVQRAKTKGLRGVHAEGELAAEIFALLASGAGVVDVIRELRVHPDVVEHVAAQHARMTAAVVVDAATLDALRSLLPAGDERNRRATDGAELLVQMQSAVAIAHPCRGCNDATARFCASCVPTPTQLQQVQPPKPPPRPRQAAGAAPR